MVMMASRRTLRARAQQATAKRVLLVLPLLLVAVVVRMTRAASCRLLGAGCTSDSCLSNSLRWCFSRVSQGAAPHASCSTYGMVLHGVRASQTVKVPHKYRSLCGIVLRFLLTSGERVRSFVRHLPHLPDTPEVALELAALPATLPPGADRCWWRQARAGRRAAHHNHMARARAGEADTCSPSFQIN